LTIESTENLLKYRDPRWRRIFTLNYIATKRTGKREVYATTSSGGGLESTSLPGQQVALSPGGVRTGYTDLISVDEVDLWREIQKGLESLIFGTIVVEKEKEVSSEKEKTTLTWTRADEKGRKLIINKSPESSQE
jgi:hypothetical protein